MRGPEIFSIHPSFNKGYAPSEDTNDVSVVDLLTKQVIKVIPVGQSPHHSTMSPNGLFVYVVNGGKSRSISAIDTTLDEVVATIPVGLEPTGMVFTPIRPRSRMSGPC